MILSMSDELLSQALYFIMEDDQCYEIAKEVADLIDLLYAEA